MAGLLPPAMTRAHAAEAVDVPELPLPAGIGERVALADDRRRVPDAEPPLQIGGLGPAVRVRAHLVEELGEGLGDEPAEREVLGRKRLEAGLGARGHGRSAFPETTNRRPSCAIRRSRRSAIGRIARERGRLSAGSASAPDHLSGQGFWLFSPSLIVATPLPPSPRPLSAACIEYVTNGLADRLIPPSTGPRDTRRGEVAPARLARVDVRGELGEPARSLRWIVVHRWSLAMESSSGPARAARSGRAGGEARAGRAAGGASGRSPSPGAATSRTASASPAVQLLAAGLERDRDVARSVELGVVVVVDARGCRIHSPLIESTSLRSRGGRRRRPVERHADQLLDRAGDRAEAPGVAARELRPDGPTRRRTGRSGVPGTGRRETPRVLSGERHVDEVARDPEHRRLPGLDVHAQQHHRVGAQQPAAGAGVGADQEDVQPAVAGPVGARASGWVSAATSA